MKKAQAPERAAGAIAIPNAKWLFGVVYPRGAPALGTAERAGATGLAGSGRSVRLSFDQIPLFAAAAFNNARPRAPFDGRLTRHLPYDSGETGPGPTVGPPNCTSPRPWSTRRLSFNHEAHRAPVALDPKKVYAPSYLTRGSPPRIARHETATPALDNTRTLCSSSLDDPRLPQRRRPEGILPTRGTFAVSPTTPCLRHRVDGPVANRVLRGMVDG